MAEETVEAVEIKETPVQPESLVPLDKYLAAGVHIGTQRKLNDMKKFIYKVRDDGLSVLDVGAVNNRIKVVANFISKYKPEKVVVACARDVGKKLIRGLLLTL